jgi:MFS family permease
MRLDTLNEENYLFESKWVKSKNSLMKNLLIISIAWVFLFTAFQSMANLQSSLNSNEGLGTASLSTIYITLVISCLFLPPIIINRLGLKWTIIFSQMAYLLYLLANIYPAWLTLIPTAIILGIGAGPLWTAKCTYLTEIAGFYSQQSGEANEAVVNRFFGIFFCIFQLSQIVGNLITSTILKPEVDTTTAIFNNNCGAKG